MRSMVVIGWFSACGADAPSEPAVGRAMLAGPGRLDRRERRVRVFVAAPRAIAQLGHRVENLRGVDLLVFVGLEGSGVATRAIRLVGGELPCDHLVVGRVAGRARDTAVMGLVERRNVAVRARRNPAGGAVTRVTRARRDEMAARLAFRAGAVVTGRAGSGGDPGMRKRRGDPRRGAVALVAGRGRGQMRRRLTLRARPVVAGRAGSWRDARYARRSPVSTPWCGGTGRRTRWSARGSPSCPWRWSRCGRSRRFPA